MSTDQSGAGKKKSHNSDLLLNKITIVVDFGGDSQILEKRNVKS